MIARGRPPIRWRLSVCLTVMVGLAFGHQSHGQQPTGQPEFVPGEVLVQFRVRADPDSAMAAADLNAAASGVASLKLTVATIRPVICAAEKISR